MKVRKVRKLGFRPMINADGKLILVLPLVEISEDVAANVSPAQLDVILEKSLDPGIKRLDLARTRLARLIKKPDAEIDEEAAS